MPRRTLQVVGAQLTFTHPDRSRPLNSGTNPPGFALGADRNMRTLRPASAANTYFIIVAPLQAIHRLYAQGARRNPTSGRKPRPLHGSDGKEVGYVLDRIYRIRQRSDGVMEYWS